MYMVYHWSSTQLTILRNAEGVELLDMLSMSVQVQEARDRLEFRTLSLVGKLDQKQEEMDVTCFFLPEFQ